MENYIKPSLVEYGKSESLIKGACGWGSENWTLDKTGAYKTTRRKMVSVGWLPGFTEVFKCKSVSACSSDKNQC